MYHGHCIDVTSYRCVCYRNALLISIKGGAGGWLIDNHDVKVSLELMLSSIL